MVKYCMAKYSTAKYAVTIYGIIESGFSCFTKAMHESMIS